MRKAFKCNDNFEWEIREGQVPSGCGPLTFYSQRVLPLPRLRSVPLFKHEPKDTTDNRTVIQSYFELSEGIADPFVEVF